MRSKALLVVVLGLVSLPESAIADAGIDQPLSLAVRPNSIRLTGAREMQQVIVTGRYADGSERDLTSVSVFRIEAGDVAVIGAGGLVEPRKNGRTTLTIQSGAHLVRVPIVVEGLDRPQPVSFRHEFIASVNVAGCNMGACHGLPSGRGGFKLSLRGFDPAADFQELTREVFGRRTNPLDPEASLIWQKGTGRVPHEGGPRLLSINPVPGRMIRAWLAEGLRNDRDDLPTLQKITVEPGPRVLRAPARRQQLAVLATFGDGSVRDVTRLSVFSSSDDLIARVDATGLVEMQQVGEAAILCRYLDVIECVRLTYVEPRPDFRWPSPPENNYVDRHVFAKLKMLNIAPSELCSDQVFLRRVYLDLCGILPTADDVQRFLADKSADRRTALIDRLLARPEYADYWAHKWLDLLRSNRKHIQITGSHAYRGWMRRHFDRNTPWNAVVRELLTAGGSTFSNPPANFYRGNYDGHKPSVARDPQTLAEMTSQLFLGVRMQCAQCHNHPYERWSQDDYYHLAAWFAQVKARPDELHPGGPRPNYPWQLRENAIVVFPTRSGEVTQPRTGKVMPPRIMGMPLPAIPPGADRRQVLAEQMTSAHNPFFARAAVNRVWFHLLGKGIVDPPDDFRDSNPSANDALLDALARDFVAQKFDMKHMIRTIVNSRTYQLSSDTNETNQNDEKYFSHALVMSKRLSAEVLLDAICTATSSPEKFPGYPLGTRAVQLPDGEVVNTGGRYAGWDRHPFLKAFGQPARELVCECEREGDVSVARVLEMKNGPFVRAKIQAADNRLGKLLARKLPDGEVLNELFLATLSRMPLEDEARAALDVVQAATNKRAAWESVLWALLNTNEFLFRY